MPNHPARLQENLFAVIPAKAGIPWRNVLWDSCLRRNDGEGGVQ
jgi:hypothetical protein